MTDTEGQSLGLFSPVTIGSLTLPNRIFMAPMTRNRAVEGNLISDLTVEYYRQRASAGLIISEASQVSPQGVGYPSTPGIHSTEQIKSWRKLTDAVHKDGGHIFIQLWHVGRISHPSLQLGGDVPVAPSAIKPVGEAVTYDGMQTYVTPRELTHDEISSIVDDYRQATLNAREAGFDGVEIHAANGYLIDQFLRDGTNHRTDEYGGTVANRTRFLEEVVLAVISSWDAEHVGVRISPENEFNDIHESDPQGTFEYVATKLNQYNLAYLHVLEGNMVSDVKKCDYQKFKKLFGGHYMANMGYNFETATQAIQSGHADSVAFGALYIANPDLVERFRTNAELNVPDDSSFYGGDEKGYTDYPFMEGKRRAIHNS